MFLHWVEPARKLVLLPSLAARRLHRVQKSKRARLPKPS